MDRKALGDLILVIFGSMNFGSTPLGGGTTSEAKRGSSSKPKSATSV
jgi:hypothetical protein